MRITLRKEGEKRKKLNTKTAKTLGTVTHTHTSIFSNLSKSKVDNKIKIELLQNLKKQGLKYLSRAPTTPSYFWDTG